jgi:hypothetical protein
MFNAFIQDWDREEGFGICEFKNYLAVLRATNKVTSPPINPTGGDKSSGE